MKILVLLIIILLSGCEPSNNFTGGRDQNGAYYPEVCLNGVVYYRVGNSLAIAGRKDGTFYLCESKN